MKVLLLNQEGYQREECCTGKINLKILPSQIILASAYLEKNGKDVTFVDTQIQDFPNLLEFEVVVVWVSTFNGFYDDKNVVFDIAHNIADAVMGGGCAFDAVEMGADFGCQNGFGIILFDHILVQIGHKLFRFEVEVKRFFLFKRLVEPP